ncbi:MATE family efflux transporter [Schaedlerella arabinosiphila]|uniref:MATE family efflux transporter n=1 Tax=Schaedlerella arabinosiphila TaxID=2044587 RepID=A0A3R8KRI9_9FIRM|nr:MATE family efflux transporter [Schaedlerella arabinosiphila]RRK30135.1 MATE family efflux transporter [Schaedlerella arabinosiphila]
MNHEKISWVSFFRTVLTIALPIALQNFLSTTASMVDTIMIGSQGELSVAAVGICSQISSLFFSCYFGFASGGLLFFSQYWGARNEKGINRVFGLALACMLAVSVLFGGAAVANPEFILGIYTDKADIIAIGAPYIRIVGFAYPLQVIAMIISFLMRSTERVKPPLISSVLALITNFILNWILIYGRFGTPKMGAAGAAVGTLVSGVVNVLVLLMFLMKDQKTVELRLKEMFSWQDGFLKEYMGKCLPIICNELFYGIGQMLINIVIGHQSASAIAAMAAFRVLEGFVFAFFAGLADASSVVVGKEVGSGHLMSGYQYMKKFSVLCPAITFCICLIGLLLNRPLLSLFGLGAEAMFFGKYMILIYLAAGTIRTCNYIMNCCYRAGGEAVFGTLLEIICLFTVSVPATWAAGMIWHLPFLAVFSFLYTDELIRLAFELWYTVSGKWIKPVTEMGQAALPEFRSALAARKKRL